MTRLGDIQVAVLIALGLGSALAAIMAFGLVGVKYKKLGALFIAASLAMMAVGVQLSLLEGGWWITPAAFVLLIVVIFGGIFLAVKAGEGVRKIRNKAKHKAVSDRADAEVAETVAARARAQAQLQEELDRIASRSSSSFTPTADPQPVPVTGKIDYNRRR
jgi:hypothetical protein